MNRYREFIDMNRYQKIIKDLENTVATMPIRPVVKDGENFLALTNDEFDRVVNVLLNTKLTLELDEKEEF